MTKEQIIEKCKESFIYLGNVVTPDTFDLPSPKFHFEIEDVVLGNAKWVYNKSTDSYDIVYGNFTNKKICIEAPRGYAKSTLIAAYAVLHHLLFYGDKTYIIIQSKTRKEAVKRLRKIKNIFHSRVFRAVFDKHYNESTCPIWREDKILTPDGDTIEAIGTGQQTRGLKEDDTRVTLWVLDDPEDENNTKTQDSMDDNFHRLLTSLPALSKNESQIIIIGTPIHQMCMVERLMNAEGWVTAKFPACDEITKEVLWHEYETYEDLMQEKKEMMSLGKVSVFYSEKMLVITGDEDAVFREADIQYYKGFIDIVDGEAILNITSLNKKELEEPILKPVNLYMGVDPASSESSKSDYSTTVMIAYDEDQCIYVLPYFEKQVRPSVHAEDIINKIIEYPIKRVNVETVSYQESLRNIINDYLREKNKYQYGLEKKWTPRRDKDTRLKDLERFTVNKKLYLQENMHTLLAELLNFPRGRKNLLDGLWYATRYLSIPDHSTEPIKKEEEDEPTLSWMGMV